MSKGIVFFNFGTSCILRLIVSVYSFRQVSASRAALLVDKEDVYQNVFLKDFCKEQNIDYLEVDMTRICHKNFKSVMAPKVLKESPFESSIQIDTDTTFQEDPSFLLDKCEEYGVFVSHFNNWHTTDRIMTSRINSFSDVLDPNDLHLSLQRRPAINCGVVGYKKGVGDEFQREWEELTNRTAGRFIAEEIACQCVFWKYFHYMAPPPWNSSVKWGILENSKIIHYHGNKHTSLERRNSRYWWSVLGRAIRDGAISKEEVVKWGQFDKNAKKVIDQSGFNHIDLAVGEFEEYENKRHNNIIVGG